MSRTSSHPPAHAEPAAAPVSLALPERALRWLVPLLVLHGGLFLGLASPMRPNAFAWPIALVPMFLALDLSLRRWPGTWRTDRWGGALRVFGCTYPVGVVFAIVTGDWVVNTAYVYGALPVPLAYAVSWLGYGSLVGLEVCFFLGLPFALAWRRPLLALVLVPLWVTVGQVYVPRFLAFTYGQAMYTVPPLVQFADVLGSGGLNLLWVPLQLVLYLWLRRLYAPAELPLRPLGAATAALAVLFAAAWGYGAWSMERWAARTAAGDPVQLVGIQPNFTLRDLASNPALSHSEREQSLRALLDDSAAALSRAPRRPGVPRVLLWPESVYPRPYFLARGMREVVELWVRSQGVHLVLASQDTRVGRTPDGRPTREAYGAAVHVGPQGEPRGVYHKVTLIPFGETIPFGDLLPPYRKLLQAWIPRIAQFTPGREYPVFPVGGVGLAPMICFDAANPAVARRMADNGARLGVVLANLAWFGRSTVSNQFGWFARFRAIENRMPLLFLSQNGESFLLDASGREVTPRLPQFEAASFVREVRAPRETPFYTRHATAVQRGYPVALLAVIAAGWGPAALRRWRHRPA